MRRGRDNVRISAALLLLWWAGSFRPTAALACSSAARVAFLTIVLPAYNEETRLPATLRAYTAALAAHPTYATRSRLLVVNDGSTDGTAALVETWHTNHDNNDMDDAACGTIPVTCVSLAANAGKGAALAAGLAASLQDQPQGWICTADADGSVTDLPQTLEAMVASVERWYHDTSRDMHNDDTHDEAILVAGYRTYGTQGVPVSRRLTRWGFATVVRILCRGGGNNARLPQVRDSQCGCKLLNPAAAAWLYRDLHQPGWSHDVEVLLRCAATRRPLRTSDLPPTDNTRGAVVVLEAPVAWQDQPGSKLVESPGGVLVVSAHMLWQVLQLRWGYASGTWRLPDETLSSNEDA